MGTKGVRQHPVTLPLNCITRALPQRLPQIGYLAHFVVKKLPTGGAFRFHYKLLYLANSLVNQHIGLEETDDGMWSVYFNTLLIATLDTRGYIIPT